MNIRETPATIFRLIYRYVLQARWLFGKKICKTFNQVYDKSSLASIEHIYVINLDRQQHRWKQIQQELSYILDATKKPLTNRTTRISAVDARQFDTKVQFEDIVQTYTLGEQLFVDPRQVLPKRLDLDEEIQMSRQEIAVALSHVNTWRHIAEGHHEYALVLEDDIHFKYTFPNYLDTVWKEIFVSINDSNPFDILYLSYKEVDLGAEKMRISENTYKLFRGIWYLSGYVLSKNGATKLLSLLPLRGPVDLWINHKFNDIDALMASKSFIIQRMDVKSENFYSALPVLSKIGILNSETAGFFHSKPLISPIFAIGMPNTKLTSLAMAMSMLGYRCCSDLDTLPKLVEDSLIHKDETNFIFNAFVNIGTLEEYLEHFADVYPEARLILLINESTDTSDLTILDENIFINRIQKPSQLLPRWKERALILPADSQNQWKLLCEFLGSVPPAAAYPELPESGQRMLCINNNSTMPMNLHEQWLRADKSPWIVDNIENFDGLNLNENEIISHPFQQNQAYLIDLMDQFNESQWQLREDTFQGNLALFSPSNFSINSENAIITLRSEDMGVRQYSSGAITSNDKFLFGRFEAVIKLPKVTGLVSGLFLHRDSPRQEIDIEFLGNNPTKILVNVFYNPGDEGARFDYGYRGTPTLIEVGFDTTSDFHKYAIEWSPNKIQWFVDDKIVHTRVNWAPTPIPHLPMKFHVNLWPSQSQELAGKLNNQLLPASTILKSVRIFTTCDNCINT